MYSQKIVIKVVLVMAVWICFWDLRGSSAKSTESLNEIEFECAGGIWRHVTQQELRNKQCDPTLPPLIISHTGYVKIRDGGMMYARPSFFYIAAYFPVSPCSESRFPSHGTLLMPAVSFFGINHMIGRIRGIQPLHPHSVFIPYRSSTDVLATLAATVTFGVLDHHMPVLVEKRMGDGVRMFTSLGLGLGGCCTGSLALKRAFWDAKPREAVQLLTATGVQWRMAYHTFPKFGDSIAPGGG